MRKILVQLPCRVKKGLLEYIRGIGTAGHSAIQSAVDHAVQAIRVLHEDLGQTHAALLRKHSSPESVNMAIICTSSPRWEKMAGRRQGPT